MAVFTSPTSGAILWNNFLKDASIVSSPSNLSSLTPISNILVQNRSSIILLTNNSGGSIVFDLGTARRPTVIAIVDSSGVITNPTSAQQWILYGADDVAITTNVVSWVFPIYNQGLTRYYLGGDKLAGCATFSVSNDIGIGLATTSDNKIIVNSKISGAIREVRFLSDGDLDTSFGSGNGYVDTDLAGYTSETANAMLKDASGARIVVGTMISGNTYAQMSRYTDAGAVDTGYSVDGKDFHQASGDTYTYGVGIDQQSTAHYVVFGSHGNSSVTNYAYFYRCTSGGASPATLADLSGSGTYFTAIKCVVDNSDRPIGLGYTFTTFTDIKICVMRTDSTISALDTTFNGTGKFEYSFNLSTLASTIPTGMDIQSSNRIIVASTPFYDNPTTGTTYTIWGIIRIRSSTGTLDGSFATNGKFTYDWGGNAQPGVVKVLSDDSIVIGGQGIKNGMACIAFMKLTSDGVIDTSFGTEGISTIFAGALTGQVKDIQVLSNGKFLVTGYFQNYTGSDNYMFLMRLNSNGTIDTTFSPTATNDGKRYWKLMIGTTNETPASAKIGYLFLGDYVDIRPNTGTDIEYKDESPTFESRSGAMYSDLKPITRDVDFNIEAATKDELEALRNAMNTVGNHSPIILDLFANSSDTVEAAAGTVYGYFDNTNYFNIDLNTAQTDNIKIKIVESPE